MDDSRAPELRTAGEDAEAEGLSAREVDEAEERSGPRAPVVFASIAARGRDELERPALSLFGSAVSAGLVISLSLIAQGILHATLPDFEGKSAVTDFGYSVGFALVIIGRMQLFTENTITPVLPLLADPSGFALWRTARLWAIVLAGNLVGTFLAALTLHSGGIVAPPHLAGIVEVATAASAPSPGEMLRLAVPAGFSIAALVWCLPAVRGGELMLIVLVTYVIALGDFAHVVVGSAEFFLAALDGAISPMRAAELLAATFAGNVLGGTLLFAVLAYIQVREEMSAEQREEARRSREDARRARG